MLPRSIIYFLVVLVIDLILKSLKEKKEIKKGGEARKIIRQKAKEEDVKVEGEEERLEDIEAYMESTVQSIEELVSSEEYIYNTYEEKPPKEEGEVLSNKVLGPETRPKIGGKTLDEREGIQDIIKDEIKSKKKAYKIKKSREDIIKGIIYSEILSKPKSLRR